MSALIAAEAAIFTIFVVAYLFYVGKSLSGPMPREVLSPPFFYTFCLLSSSLTIHFASRSLRRWNASKFWCVVASDDHARRNLPLRNGVRNGTV
jgi:cytochrome c oxidase subunit 3